MRNLWICLAGLLLVVGTGRQAKGDIIVGPYTFDDRAFADVATQLEPGPLAFVGGAADLEGALTGFSPATGLVNIGSSGDWGTTPNDFLLEFTDFLAINAEGPDLVFFDARFSADGYDIAVRTAGGGESSFTPFAYTEFADTGEDGPIFGEGPPSDLFGLSIELDDFGLPAGTIVDAIRFRGAISNFGNIQGDPVMAAVLNGEPSTAPIPEPRSAVLFAIGALTVGGALRRTPSSRS